jgi:hypothetical protein
MTTAYFFSYVDNNVSTAQLSCIELRMTVSSVAATSFIAERFTSPTKSKTTSRRKQFEQCVSARSQHLLKLF